jgi:hypothetical protein
MTPTLSLPAPTPAMAPPAPAVSRPAAAPMISPPAHALLAAALALAPTPCSPPPWLPSSPPPLPPRHPSAELKRHPLLPLAGCRTRRRRPRLLTRFFLDHWRGPRLSLSWHSGAVPHSCDTWYSAATPSHELSWSRPSPPPRPSCRSLRPPSPSNPKVPDEASPAPASSPRPWRRTRCAHASTTPSRLPHPSSPPSAVCSHSLRMPRRLWT